VAFLVLGACAVALALLVRVGLDKVDDSGTEARPAPVAPRPPKPLRIIFPEGFTREQMAARITAVNEIARDKRGVDPRLDAKRYLAITAESPVAARFARDGEKHSLEGFLFPAN
jgi:hypothetical protein